MFHGPITYDQEHAAELFCMLHEPQYCLMIWYVPGHPFHRHACKQCPWY